MRIFLQGDAERLGRRRRHPRPRVGCDLLSHQCSYTFVHISRFIPRDKVNLFPTFPISSQSGVVLQPVAGPVLRQGSRKVPKRRGAVLQPVARAPSCATGIADKCAAGSADACAAARSHATYGTALHAWGGGGPAHAFRRGACPTA